jgi:hypothetical protein
VRVWLRQGQRETEARIGMGHNDQCEWYLTLGEARALRDRLGKLLAEAT